MAPATADCSSGSGSGTDGGSVDTDEGVRAQGRGQYGLWSPEQLYEALPSPSAPHAAGGGSEGSRYSVGAASTASTAAGRGMKGLKGNNQEQKQKPGRGLVARVGRLVASVATGTRRAVDQTLRSLDGLKA